MAGFGSFYKGDKKKKKKGEEQAKMSYAPTFTLPTITGKTKKEGAQ